MVGNQTNEEKSKGNLLPVPKEKSIGIMKLANGLDNIKSIVKALGWSAIGFPMFFAGIDVISGLTSLSVVGAYGLGIPIAVAGIGALHRMATHLTMNSEPGLLFGISKGKDFLGRKKVGQDLQISKAIEMWKVPEEKSEQKISMMQVQLLVGLSRIKDRLRGSPYTEKEDGTRIYNQQFTTVTHKINGRTLSALAELGMVEMVEIDDKIGKRDKTTGERTQKKSLLIAEKLGFGNKKDLKLYLKCVRERNWEKLNAQRTVMKRYTFRLTDTPIDFVNLYAKSRRLIPCDSETERGALMKLGHTFSGTRGALSKLNYDIQKDAFGRDILVRTTNEEENFSQRVDREIHAEELAKTAVEMGIKYVRTPPSKGESEFDKSLRCKGESTTTTLTNIQPQLEHRGGTENLNRNLGGSQQTHRTISTAVDYTQDL